MYLPQHPYLPVDSKRERFPARAPEKADLVSKIVLFHEPCTPSSRELHPTSSLAQALIALLKGVQVDGRLLASTVPRQARLKASSTDVWPVQGPTGLGSACTARAAVEGSPVARSKGVGVVASGIYRQGGLRLLGWVREKATGVLLFGEGSKGGEWKDQKDAELQ